MAQPHRLTRRGIRHPAMVPVPELGRSRGMAPPDRLSGQPPPALAAAFLAWRKHSPAAAARACGQALRHGDLARWLRALDELPAAAVAGASFGRVVTARAQTPLGAMERDVVERALLGLRPWRKGPFRLLGVFVDAEWRSDAKWARVAPHVALRGRRVLDVGCGNGYYGWRMLAAGARAVTGIDPNPLAVLQHAAVAHYVGAAGAPGARGDEANVVLPIAIEDFAPAAPFDAIFSMGVVYHRRDPAGHLRALARHAHAGTTLVVESLLVDGAPLRPFAERKRYARMPNVHVVPNLSMLRGWARAAGFRRAEVVDVTATTTAEQRPTAFMPRQSLAHALDPGDRSRTVEGFPAPKRAVMIAAR